MAFTSAPETQTYSSQRLPVVRDLKLIPSGTDTTFYNGIENLIPVKTQNDETSARMRYGFNGTQTGTSNHTRGCYVWEKTATTIYYFVVVGSSIRTSTNGTSWTTVDTLTTSSGVVRFTEFISSTGTKSLILVDGIEGYVYTSNAAGTKIADADFPSPHVPFPVFMDGYLFLAKANTGDIYNSNLDDPSLWTAGDFISSEVYPDDVQALIKIDNYILAVGLQGSEFFYDAANATGSPLARYEGGLLPFGTYYPNTIASTKNTAVFLANKSNGESVFQFIEGMKYKTLDNSSDLINRVNSLLGTISFSYTTLRACFLRMHDQTLYMLNSTQESITVATFPSVAFCLEAGIWINMSYGASTRWPVFASAQGATTSNLTTYVAGTDNSNRSFFGPLTAAFNYDQIIGQSARAIVARIYIDDQDFGTLNRKFINRIGLGFMTSSDDIPTIRWSDNSGVTFTSDRAFAGGTQSGDGGFPFITQCGSTRRRRFVITFTDDSTLSATNVFRAIFYYVEFDINKGQQ